MYMVVFVIAFVSGVFVLIPACQFPPEAFTTYIDGAFNVFDAVFYVLPAGTCLAIFGLIFTIQSLRVGIAFVKMIWDLLPIA